MNANESDISEHESELRWQALICQSMRDNQKMN